MAKGMIVRRGGGGLPSGWMEEVTAAAYENITAGDAVEYCAYPSDDTFIGAYEAYPYSPYALKYSSDGQFRVFNDTTNKHIGCIQRLIDGVWTTLFSGAVSSTNVINSVEITAHGECVLFAVNNSRIFGYQFNGSTYTVKGELYTFAGGQQPNVLKLSLDDVYLVVMHSSYDLATAFKLDKSTCTLTKLEPISGIPSGTSITAGDIDCTADGIYWLFTYISGSTTSRAYSGMLKRNGDTFSCIKQGTDIRPAVEVSLSRFLGCAIAPDGSTFILADSQYIRPFTLVNDVITSMPQATVHLSQYTVWAGGRRVFQYTPSGSHLICLPYAAPYVQIYQVNSTQYVKLANPAQLPVVVQGTITIDGAGKLISIPSSSAGGVFTYTTSSGAPLIRKLRSMLRALVLLPNQFSFFGIGMAKNTVAANEQCKALLFKKINDAQV